MASLRAEAARIYRKARRDELEVNTAWRFISMLRIIAEMTASEVIEKRLDKIEGEVKPTGNGLGIRHLTLLKKESA